MSTGGSSVDNQASRAASACSIIAHSVSREGGGRQGRDGVRSGNAGCPNSGPDASARTRRPRSRSLTPGPRPATRRTFSESRKGRPAVPTYLSPGVYMEEVSSGSKPIEGVGTAVAAFVGFAEAGPVNTPILVTNWTQFVSNFGGFIEGSFLAHAVYAYFLNGGGVAYVVRVGADESDGESDQPTAQGELPAAEGDKAPFTVKALESGSAGDGISVEIADASEPSDDNFKLIVRAQG